MQINKISCSQLLDEFGIVPSKDKGQNYLINPATAKRIAESLDIEESDKVLEIGPGLGSLTHFIDEKHDNLSLVEIELLTGRHHQIRVQFASRGHCLYGDQRYGKQDNEQIALWAYNISFTHPVKKENVSFKCFPLNDGIWKIFGTKLQNNSCK